VKNLTDYDNPLVFHDFDDPGGILSAVSVRFGSIPNKTAGEIRARFDRAEGEGKKLRIY
jgi:hypothetical protein